MHRFALALGMFLLLGNSLPAAVPTDAAPFWPVPGAAPVLSPRGHWVAWISGDETDGTLWVAPAGNPETRQSIPIPAGRGRARDLAWTGSEELVVLSLGEQGGGFWVLRCPGVILQPLSPPAGFQFVRLLHPQPAAEARICLEGVAVAPAKGGLRSPWLDLLTVDVSSGQVVRVTRNPGDVVEWFADASGTARLALAVSGTRQELRVRPEGAAEGRWRTGESWDLAGDPVSVLALASDGSRAWISARLGRDTRGVYEFDVSAGRFSHALAVDERFDIVGGLQVSGNLPVSLSWERLLPNTVWFDAEWKATLEALAGKFSDGVWTPVSVSEDARRAVISKVSDRFPAEFAVVRRGDPAGIRFISQSKERPALGVARIPVELTARDGVVVTGYFTGSEEHQRKPMVVLVHGGPWTRDVWGWDPEAQFLASRGWCVLQLNYRGSAGFGRRFQEAGGGAWAGVSTDDLLDGVRWAIGKGHADPARVVVVGESFGGFLAYAAMTDDENPFCAGVTLGGVFDLPQWLDSRAAGGPPYVQAVQRRRLLGTSRPDPRWAERRLPHLQCPLLVIQAQDDEVVPAVLAERLMNRAAGSKAPIIVRRISSGGHRFQGTRNAPVLWDELESWLSRDPRVPGPSPSTPDAGSGDSK